MSKVAVLCLRYQCETPVSGNDGVSLYYGCLYRLSYAFTCLGSASVGQAGRMDFFLNRAHKWEVGFL